MRALQLKREWGPPSIACQSWQRPQPTPRSQERLQKPSAAPWAGWLLPCLEVKAGPGSAVLVRAKEGCLQRRRRQGVDERAARECSKAQRSAEGMVPFLRQRQLQLELRQLARQWVRPCH